MHSRGPRRWLAVGLLLGSGIACAQTSAPPANSSALPATSPTVAPAAAMNAQPPQPPVRLAKVEFVDGKLTVTADNSSLNQILREVCRQTGMKITGGVTDERVFGSYGPATAGEVLASLLEGTGSNMELQQTPAKVPVALILTEQHGGPTPPNPNAPGLTEIEPQNNEGAVTMNQPPQQASPQQPMGPAGAGGLGSPVAPQGYPAQLGPAQTGSNPQSPNGVQTPQQIFEQLQRMQQQSQQH